MLAATVDYFAFNAGVGVEANAIDFKRFWGFIDTFAFRSTHSKLLVEWGVELISENVLIKGNLTFTEEIIVERDKKKSDDYLII